MRSPFAATVLSAAVLMTPLRVSASPASVTAVVAAPAQARAGLEIDTSSLGDSADPVENQIRAKGDQLRLEAELLPSRSPSDPTVHVSVTPFTGEDMGYDIALSIHREGAEVEGTAIADKCELCTEGELIDKIGGHLRTQLGKAKAMAAAKPEVEPKPDVKPEPEPEPEPAKADKVPLGNAGKAGIALAIGGVAAAGLGVGLIVKKDTVVDNGVHLKTTHPPGYAVVAVGGVLLVTGVALLVVDRMKAKKSSGSAARSKLVLPYASPQGAGVSFSTRF